MLRWAALVLIRKCGGKVAVVHVAASNGDLADGHSCLLEEISCKLHSQPCQVTVRSGAELLLEEA